MAYATYALKDFIDADKNTYQDIYLDNNGNIATVQDDPAILQTCQTNLQLWLGEYIYDTNRGLNYPAILGKTLNQPFLYSEVKKAIYYVKGVQGITNIKYKYDYTTRKLSLSVYVKTSSSTFLVQVGN